MAKLTDNEVKLLIADYHTGKFSQRKLAEKYNVSIGKVNQLTKEVTPINEHLVNAQMSILSAKSQLTNEQMNAIMNTAQELAFNKGLVFNVSQKALQKASMLLDQSEDMNELKTAVDLADRASLTLGVNQRHAPKVEIKTGDDNSMHEGKTIVFQRIGKE